MVQEEKGKGANAPKPESGLAHEAKMGLIFVAILLTAFGALVLKRLVKHGNLPPMNLNGSAAKSTDAASLSHLPPQPTPPTVLTPLNEDSRPPEFATNDRGALKQNSDPTWSSSPPHPVRAETTQTDSTPSAAQPPSLLAEPLPVADVGNRYNTPVPYRSSYRDANDDSRPTPSATVEQPKPDPPIDPFPRISPPQPQPLSDRTAIDSEPPMTNRQNNSSTAMSGAGLENPTVNRLRAPPANLSSQPTARIAAINNDRFLAQPAPQPISQNPPPTYDYPPRTSPTSDYTPHASAQSDSNQRDSGSGVITASVPAGIQRNGDQYTAGPNDSFWIISEKAYGSGGYFKALFELNRKRTKDSEDLKVGDVLTVPDEAVIRRMYPDLCPKPRKPTAGTQQRMLSASNRLQGAGRVYTVVDGDTLFEIARHELGRPARWAEIYELNRDVVGDDFDYLRPGTELILPDHPNGPADSHSSNTAIRQPDSLYPR